MRVVVTEVGWDGSIRRRALETIELPDAGRWDHLIEQVLACPPLYRAAPGTSVYVIHAGNRAVLVGEENLVGSLHELVRAILQTGGPSYGEESQ
jgi:hypothetical protein